MQYFKSPYGKGTLLLLLFVACAVMVSWRIPYPKNIFTEYLSEQDTIPDQDRKLKALDEALEQLDNVKTELSKKDIEKEVAEALKKVNVKDIQSKVDRAMADADLALSSVDLEKIQLQVNKAIANIDIAKINEEIKSATEKIKPEIEASIQKALTEIENAKKDLRKEKDRIR